jgi:hypothetical protein
LSPEGGCRRGKVLHPEFFRSLRNSVSKLPSKDARAKLTIVINIILAQARIDASDDIVEVLVDEHRGCAKDDEVEVEDGEGVIEVGFSEDQADDAFDLSEP